MVEGIAIGFSDMLSIAQTIGIVGTMVLTLIFSKRHIQSLSSHQQTRVLNDLDEKVRKMIEIIIEKPTMQMSYINLKSHQKNYHLHTISCLLVPMHILCVKKMCSMMRNGQAGYIG